VKSDITYKPAAGVITGTWSETSYGINGWVSGNAGTGRISALVESREKTFSAKVSVVTNGSEQVVKIEPRNLEVTEVEVTLQRTG
jgi:hypothetical protein